MTRSGGTAARTRSRKSYPPQPTVSVIVPVHDNAVGLRETLDRLRAQTYSEGLLEVIVVDNGSTDDTTLLSSRYPDVVWLEEPRPGSYRARNTGVRAARGKILAFTDSDCEPAEDWIEEGVAALLATPQTGFVGGRIEVAFGDPSNPSIYELYDSLCSFNQQETLTRFNYAATANLFTTSHVVETVGPFDERLRSGGDCEWCNRVVEAGWLPTLGDSAVVRHPGRASLRALVAKSLRVTVGSMVSSERGRSRRSWRYVQYHLLSRPRRMLASLSRADPPVPLPKTARVLGLYFMIKCLQAGERLRVIAGGTPRR